MSSVQTKTANLSLALPADESANTPWGADDKMLATAIVAIDAQLVSAFQQHAFDYAADTGSLNAYAVALTPTPTLQAGLGFYFKAAHTNTGASTLAVNGGTAKAITKTGTTALSGSEINAGQIVHVMYDGTQFQLISQ